MTLGNSLYNARKARGLSQEAVAERLGVSRQTISKWELDETLPDICQAKKLSSLYQVTLDELIDFDAEANQIKDMINAVSEETQRKIDWTKLWASKYPILQSYQQEVDVNQYRACLQELLGRLRAAYGYGAEDAFLVLKDILAQIWKQSGQDA